jgi:hypothetical protein
MTFFDKHKRVEFSPSGGLRHVQRFVGGGQAGLPSCDVKDCISQAMGLFADETNKAFCICPTHSSSGEFKTLLAKQATQSV